MLLVITNSQDATADYLLPILDRSAIPTFRFDTDRILNGASFRYAAGWPAFRFGERWYEPRDFCQVWHRRPQRLRRRDLEDTAEGKFVLDEWTEAFEGFFSHISRDRWMNHPSANALASHKLAQLTDAANLGFRTPETCVTQDPSALRDFFARHQGRVIAKPMASGYIEQTQGPSASLIYTSRVSRADLDFLDDLAGCPTLFQQYIAKRYDVRITAVDGEFHAVRMMAREDGEQRCDIRRNNMLDVSYAPIELPADIRHLLARLLERYSLRFAAIDMVVNTAGEWIFLEVNPNGQWAWLDLEGATDIASSFVRAFQPES